ncbi:MAG: hypothetical protein R3E89_08410 [Thiolinea sp.]
MKKEQRGVLFVDVQRRLIMYLRALWGQDFFLRPTSGDFETRSGYRPYIEHYYIHLPDAFDDFSEQQDAATEDKVAGMELYRAAAAHAAAHIMHSRYDPLAEDLSALQKAMIGLVEDARVEALAIQAFPGLRPLWLKLLPVKPDDDSTAALLDRMARTMADEQYDTDHHPLVAAARSLFRQAGERLEDPRLAWELGKQLASEATALGIAYHPNQDLPANPYRDDNRYLWQDQTDESDGVLLPGQLKQVRKYVSVMEMWNNLDVEFAGDDAQEIWVLPPNGFMMTASH